MPSLKHKATRSNEYRRLSVPFEMPFLVTGTKLSSKEVDFFKENGFLVKKNLIDRESTDEALGESWDYLLKNVPLGSGVNIERSDPETWYDPEWGAMPAAEKSGFYEGRQPNVYQGTTVKLHNCGNADFLLDLLPNNDNVRSIAHQFLGPRLRPSCRTRGVYAIFPSKKAKEPISGNTLGPHADRVCQQLNVCVYLNDVPPRNGGFTVYPGAHRIMHHAHFCEANWSPKTDYIDYLKQVVREITPVELIGSAGDVIFWHGRLIHTAGIHIGSHIRWAVFGDYSQERQCLSEDEHRELGQYEWFKDTKLFRDDPAPSQDMWKSWNI